MLYIYIGSYILSVLCYLYRELYPLCIMLYIYRELYPLCIIPTKLLITLVLNFIGFSFLCFVYKMSSIDGKMDRYSMFMSVEMSIETTKGG